MKFAPGSHSHLNLRDNPNSGEISFKKEGGRISVYNGVSRVGGGGLVARRLSEMNHEVKDAAAGIRGQGYGAKSSFPKYYGQIGFANKADFAKVVKTKEGVKFQRLVSTAIHDLNTGYHTPFGHEVPPAANFQLATKQKYNNTGGVRFRRIGGRIVPIRGPARSHDEVPF